MLIDNQRLKEMADELSISCFGKGFDGQIAWNKRLRTSAGRYAVNSKRIEINPSYMEHYGMGALRETIIHELIHHHYPEAGHGPVFQREAARLGVGRVCPPLPGKIKVQNYVCLTCGTKFQRRKRINVDKYLCGKCHGKLKWTATSLLVQSR